MVPLPPDEKFCRKCLYNLHGLLEPRCPECGTPFDPDDPSSYLVSVSRWKAVLRDLAFGPKEGWARWAGPPTRRDTVIVVVAALAAIANSSVSFFWYAQTTPGLLLAHAFVSVGLTAAALMMLIDDRWRPLRTLLAALGGVIICGQSLVCGLLDVSAVWLFFACHLVLTGAIVECGLRWRFGGYRPWPWAASTDAGPLQHRWRQTVLAYAVILVLPTTVLPWPLLMRFRMSEPALQAEALAAQSAGHGNLTPRWVGLHYIRSTRLLSDGVVFFELDPPGTVYSYRTGFAFVPNPPHPWSSRVSFARLPNWCVWAVDW